MENILKKKYKNKQLNKIKKYNKYIYIFRYNNVSNKEIILIKKNLKKLDIKSNIIKKNLLNNENININLQGCLFIVYDNDINHFNEILIYLKKLDFLVFLEKSFFFSNYKINQIYSNTNINLNNTLIKPFINFIKILKNIKTVDIA